MKLRSVLTAIACVLAVPGVMRTAVDRNIFEIDPHTIGDTKVVTTIVGGKIVYEAEAK